jgi:hypothetical protein
VDPAVVMRTDHDRFLTGIAQSRLARPERLKGAAFVPFHKPRVTGYVSGKDGSEAAAGRGHGWSEPSAVVVVLNFSTTRASRRTDDEPTCLLEEFVGRAGPWAGIC